MSYYEKRRLEPEWVEKERARSREKHERLYKGIRSKVDVLYHYRSVAQMIRRRGIDTKDKEAHHWNYNLKNSVFLLSRSAHKIIHRYIKVNYDDGYCYTNDGVKIETAEQAKNIFTEILKRRGIEESFELIEMGDFSEDVKRFSVNG